MFVLWWCEVLYFINQVWSHMEYSYGFAIGINAKCKINTWLKKMEMIEKLLKLGVKNEVFNIERLTKNNKKQLT